MIEKILPREVIEIFKLLPKGAFKVVSMPKILSLTKQVVQNYLRKDLIKLEKMQFEGVQLVAQKKDFNLNLDLNDLEVEDKKTLGEKVLEIYFKQLFNQDFVSLDLRLIHFSFDSKEKKTIWKPSHLSIQFENEFRSGLCELYQGYFEHNEELIHQGLRKIELVVSPQDLNQTIKMKDLLFSHFKEAREGEEIEFKLNEFLATFQKVFELMIDQNIQMNPQFAFLGVYLIALYHNLSHLGVSLNVKKCYQRSLNML